MGTKAGPLDPLKAVFKIFYLTCFLFLGNCTTIGFHQNSVRESMVFGEEVSIRVCLIREPGIEPEEIQSLFTSWNEELSLYHLKVEPIPLAIMERPGFYGSDIIEYLLNKKI